MAAIRTNIMAEVESLGFGRYFDPIWRTLGYSRQEILAKLNERAAEIRQRWAGATELQRRFANWVALQLS